MLGAAFSIAPFLSIDAAGSELWTRLHEYTDCELELELIQSHMAQKPMLRGEVGARALRVRSDVRGHGQVRLCTACPMRSTRAL